MLQLPSPDAQFVTHVTQTVEGWLTYSEACYLHALAARAPGEGCVVEIGSFKGRSTVVLAHASRGANRPGVVAIDPHPRGTDADLRANAAAAGLSEYVTPRVARSQEAVVGWQAPIRLLWIDGAHSYEGVRSDFELWSPFVVSGGVIAFHDTYRYEGVRRFVEESILPATDLALIGMVDNIVAAMKLAPGGARGRLRAASLRGLRRLYTQNVIRGEARRLMRHALRFASAVS